MTRRRAPLSRRELDRLWSSSVPTLANAIETFEVRAPDAGYSSQPLTCHFPELGMAVGIAMTAMVSTATPIDGGPPAIDEPAYYGFLASVDGPKLAVVQDVDDPPGGAMWGEWNANVHRAVGCIGTVTEGAVRDLDAVGRLGFHLFATSVSAGHGHGRFVDYGDPVVVAGLEVHVGDLVVADRHGVLTIPDELAVDELADVADTIDALESEIFTYCQSAAFTIDGLAELSQSVESRWPGRHSAV